MITVIGSINLDFTAVVRRQPKWGETVHAASFFVSAGGKGANQALAARRAGAAVSMVGAVGNDEVAVQALVGLVASDVDLTQIHRVAPPTGTAQILSEIDGTNLIVVSAGANSLLSAEHAISAISQLRQSDILMLQFETTPETVEAALMLSRKKGVRSILNAAPMEPEFVPLTRLAHTLVVNEAEFDVLTGCSFTEMKDREAAALEHCRSTMQNLIVTLGPQGAIAVIEGELITVEAPVIRPVDTVAAGDTFCGYYAASLELGLSAHESVKRAVHAAALACLKNGAQVSIPSAVDLEEWLKRRYHLMTTS
jgi:ribokinase